MAEVSQQSIWEAIQQVKGQVTAEVNSHLDLQIGTVQTGLIKIQKTLYMVTGQITELQQRVSTNEDTVGDLLRRMRPGERQCLPEGENGGS